MASEEDFVRDLIRQRTYGQQSQPQPWSGFPSRTRPTSIPSAPSPSLPPAPAPATLLQGLDRSYAPNNYRMIPDPPALPAVSGPAGYGPSGPTGVPAAMTGRAARAATSATPGVAASTAAALPAASAVRQGLVARTMSSPTGMGVVAAAAPGIMEPWYDWNRNSGPAAGIINDIAPAGGAVDQFLVGSQGRGAIPILPGPVGGAANVIAGLFDKGQSSIPGEASAEEAPATPADEITRIVTTAMDGGLLPPDASPAKYIAYYDVLNVMGGETPESEAAALAQVNELIAQDLSQFQSPFTPAPPPTPTEIMALQAQVAETMAPYANMAQINNAQRTDLLQSLASNLPEEYSSMRSMIAAQGLASSDLLNAYAMQANLIPQTMAMEQTIQERQAIANQLHQQSINSLLYPPSSASAGTADSLSTLLASTPKG